MKQLIIEEETRLDTVIYGYFKTLSIFDKVLEVNPHLTQSVILKKGEIVNIPLIDTNALNTKVVKTLW